MMETIDARGLDCPAPVIETKKYIDQNRCGSVCVIVDNEAAEQNVTRFLKSQGYEVEMETRGNDFYLTGSSTEACDVAVDKIIEESSGQKIMAMVSSDRIGQGDDLLGGKLMENYLKTLKEMGADLWRIVFVNGGVKLTVTGSNVLEDLKELEESGVSILVCGTCLTHFDLLDKKEVGETTNMLDIVTSMQLADKII